jgi:hypothetical protein
MPCSRAVCCAGVHHRPSAVHPGLLRSIQARLGEVEGACRAATDEGANLKAMIQQWRAAAEAAQQKVNDWQVRWVIRDGPGTGDSTRILLMQDWHVC